MVSKSRDKAKEGGFEDQEIHRVFVGWTLQAVVSPESSFYREPGRGEGAA